MADLHFAFTGDNSSFMRTVNEVTAGVRDASQLIQAEGGNIDRVISMIKTGVGTLGVGFGFQQLTSQIFSTRAEFEQLEIAFTTMLGSAEKADSLLSQLKETAAKTPFEMTDVVEGAKSLLAYGIEAEKVNGTLTSLGDIAAGLGINLKDLTWLYGTTMVQGRMFTQDFRQFQGRGIPIADELAKILGIAKEKVGEAVTAGKVGAKELEQAIANMTGEGGRFGNLMAKQSDSLKGKWENIKDTIGLMFNEIGEQTSGVMNATLDATASIVDHWQEVVGILGTVAAAYGAQKAYLTLDSAFTAAKNEYGYNAEIEQLQALVPIKEQAAKTDLEQAVASGKLTEAQASKIAALREEANAQLEALAVKEKNAIEEADAAAEKLSSINEEILGIKEYKESLLEQYTAATDAGDAERAQSIATDIATTETWLKEEASAAETLAEEAKTAATNAAAASEAKESLATQINTAQTAGNTAATGILTIAKEKLALAIAKVNAVLKANQFAIVAGAVIALGYAVYKLITYQTEAQKTTKEIEEATESINKEYAKEDRKLKELVSSFAGVKKGTQEWKDMKKTLTDQYGTYLSNLDLEIEKCRNLTEVYQLLTKAIQNSMAAKGLKDYYDENDVSGKNEEDIVKNLKKLRKKSKLSESTMDKLTPLLRDFAQNADNGNDLWSYLEEELPKTSPNNDKVWANAVIAQLKKNDLTGIIDSNKRSRQFKRDLKQYQKTAGISDDVANEVLYGIQLIEDNESKPRDKEYWENKKKDAESRLAALDDISAAGKEGNKIKDEIKEYEDKLKVYSTKTSKSSGASAAQIDAKKTESHRKLLDLMKQQAEERLKLEQDYEYERWQTRIDLMEEGEEKTLAQMQLDQSKEKTALEEQKNQAVKSEIARQKALFDAEQDEKAAGNKKYAKQVFDPENDVDQSKIKEIADRYQNLQDDLTAKQKKAEQDRIQSAKESMNNYLKEFGTYQQKRNAIEQEYKKRIEQAPDRGTRLTEIANRDKAYADLDFNEWQEGGDLALAFGDISKLSHATIQSLIKDMESYRSKIIATFDPDKIQKYEEALNNLRMADADAGFFFDSDETTEALKQRLALTQQLAEVEANIAAQQAQKEQLEQEYNSLNDSMLAVSLNTTAIGPDGKPAQSNVGPTEEDVRRADELRVKINAADKALAQSSKDSKRLRSELNGMKKVKFADILKFSNNLTKAGKNAAELAGLFSDDVADAIQDGADKVGLMFDAFSELGTNIESLAKSGKKVVNETTDAAEGVVDGASSGMKATAATTATSLSTMEKASAILAIIGAAIQLATIMVSLFSSDKKHEKRIQELQDQIDCLKDSYEDLQDAADKAYSSDASEIIEKQNANLRLQNELIKEQKAEEEAKKKSDKDKKKEYDDALKDNEKKIAENKEKAKEAIIGEDMKSAISDFASAYAEAWEDGTDAAQASMNVVKSIISSALTELLKKDIQPFSQQFYDLLAEKMKKGYLTDEDLLELDAIKAQIDAEAAEKEEQYKKIQERYKSLDELREELTDISFDSVRDDFKSLLSDMESSTEDFTNNFSDMLRNALIDGLMDSKYDALLKEWYADFADKMEDQKLTDEEREELRQKYDSIVQQGIADRNAINDIIGGGTYSQQTSFGSSWDMSQDTGDELNGRFTAMVELQAANNTLMANSNSIAADMLATLRTIAGVSVTVNGTGDNDSLLDIKDMVFLSAGYLEEVAKYTKYLIGMSSDISQMKEDIKKI